MVNLLQERNRRALELLLQKDKTIQQLQEKCRLAEQQLEEQQLRLVAAEARAKATEVDQQQLQDRVKQLQRQHTQQMVSS